MVGHKDSVTCIAEDGNILLTGSDDMTIGIWNKQNCYYGDNIQGNNTQGKKFVNAIGFMSGHQACKCMISFASPLFL